MTSGRTKRTASRDRKFFQHLAETCNVTRAALMAGYARRSVYEYRDEDPEFRRRMDEAVEIATDALEAEARRRAVEGVPEPVFYQGVECGTVQRYSDRLLELLLKGRRPDVFRERVSQEISGPGGRPIETVIETAREKLRRLIERQRAQAKAAEESPDGTGQPES
jgi:hypothetical protein